MRHVVKTIALLALALFCFAPTSRPQAVAQDSNVIAVLLGKPIMASAINDLTGMILVSHLEQFAMET